VLANLPSCLSVSQISSKSSGIAHQIRRKNKLHTRTQTREHTKNLRNPHELQPKAERKQNKNKFPDEN
jgi:hypothetical protein